MEDKALMMMLVDIIEHYKKQSRFLLWAVFAVIVMHLATIGAFLYYESTMETVTTTTTTTTQEIEGDEGNIVNGDQYNDDSQNRSVE